MFMAYPFLRAPLLLGGTAHFCYLLEPCRLKLDQFKTLPQKLQQLLTGAESQLRAGSTPQPSLRLTFRRPCFRS